MIMLTKKMAQAAKNKKTKGGRIKKKRCRKWGFEVMMIIFTINKAAGHDLKKERRELARQNKPKKGIDCIHSKKRVRVSII